jgi:hypothetical protein
VRVKFIALPMEDVDFGPGLRRGTALHRIRTFFTRVIGRLVAARP